MPPQLAANDASAILRVSAGSIFELWQIVCDQLRVKAPARLIEAVEYSLLASGKRLRPALVIQSFRACSGNEQPAPSAVASALAIELIHTFSLVHDDLPAMDDDDLRRGRPTNHKVFGEALAILAGDAMTCFAFEVLARHAKPPLVPALVSELSSSSGPTGMIGGQVLDIQNEGKRLSLEELENLHRLKTGALLRCACRMGAICANADDDALGRLTAFGEHLGLAFQIVDDLLDQTSTPQQLGKATGKDQHRGKNTYPALLGLEQTRTHARQQHALALGTLTRFNASADGLRTLASFIIERTN
jgi:geranylgeranyl diphosphate synthase, type II